MSTYNIYIGTYLSDTEGIRLFEYILYFIYTLNRAYIIIVMQILIAILFSSQKKYTWVMYIFVHLYPGT
jgi:hypothetical protein